MVINEQSKLETFTSDHGLFCHLDSRDTKKTSGFESTVCKQTNISNLDFPQETSGETVAEKKCGRESS